MNKSNYSWIITIDKICGDQTGTIGPSNGWTREEIDNCKNIKKFRMYDNDGEHYYSGIIGFKNEKDVGTEMEFGPLDDFGMPNAGCTEIKYFENGEWQTL